MLGSRSWPAFIRWKAHLKHVGRWVSHLHGRIVSSGLKFSLTESLKRSRNVFLVRCKIEIGVCAHVCPPCATLSSSRSTSPMYVQGSAMRIFFLGAESQPGGIPLSVVHDA